MLHRDPALGEASSGPFRLHRATDSSRSEEGTNTSRTRSSNRIQRIQRRSRSWTPKRRRRAAILARARFCESSRAADGEGGGGGGGGRSWSGQRTDIQLRVSNCGRWCNDGKPPPPGVQCTVARTTTTTNERRVEETPARKVTSRGSVAFSFPFPNLIRARAQCYATAAATLTGTMSKMLDTNYFTVFSVLRSPEEGEEFKRIV